MYCIISLCFTNKTFQWVIAKVQGFDKIKIKIKIKKEKKEFTLEHGKFNEVTMIYEWIIYSASIGCILLSILVQTTHFTFKLIKKQHQQLIVYFRLSGVAQYACFMLRISIPPFSIYLSYKV